MEAGDEPVDVAGELEAAAEGPMDVAGGPVAAEAVGEPPDVAEREAGLAPSPLVAQSSESGSPGENSWGPDAPLAGLGSGHILALLEGDGLERRVGVMTREILREILPRLVEEIVREELARIRDGI
ncbi:MAG: hypothetical protein HQL57_04075 [Magnetococcales bacterium]|nr:hypothetical protein [Magnetococcales bacterium]